MLSSIFTTLAGLLLLPSFFGIANAGVTHDLAGYAWSEHVGWFSFNNCGDGWTTCTGTDYGVDVDASGVLSGYAWSEHVGWVSFNASAIAGCPTAPCTATKNASNGQVSGWARACSVFQTGCSGAIKTDPPSWELGGWEGWISLQGTNYGILANGTKWTGYAYGGGSVLGSENIGWTQFRGVTSSAIPSTYGVIAKGDAVGPRTISCGVNKTIAAVGEDVVWSVYIDEAKIGALGTIPPNYPNAITWNLPTANVVSGTLNSATVTVDYASAAAPNPKPGWVTVVAGGRPYVVDCDAVDVPGVSGEPVNWYPTVLIGSFDLIGQAGITTGGLLQVNQSITLNGTIRNAGPTAIPSSVTYTNQFEIDFCNPTCDGVANSYEPGSGINDHAVGAAFDKPTSGLWTPTQAGDYKIRVCADRPNTITETNVSGTGETNNCPAAWSTTITITGAPEIPVDKSTGDCRPSPSLTQVDRQVTWNITGTITGGSPPLHYYWDFSDGGGSPSNADGINMTSAQSLYATPGTKKAVLRACSQTDASNCTEFTCSIVARVQTFTEF